MSELRVERYYFGEFEPVGALSSDDVFELTFTYDEAFCSKAQAAPLSLSLPLSRHCYDIEESLPFFEGLLPEGSARESIARELHVSPYAPFDLLQALGAEPIGAIRMGREEDLHRAGAGYTPLTEEDIDQLSKESGLACARYLKQARLSLAGAQHKVGLYVHDDPQKGKKYYVPDGVAASTHIIKTGSREFEGIVFNECFCLSLARACGIAVPDVSLVTAAQPMLAIKRFDRAIDKRCPHYDGLPNPIRLHQEDFSQALGIESAKKYEAGDNDFPRLVADLIRAACADPPRDIEALARAMIFDYLIGNCDNHIKNLSLLYSEDYRTIQLAPFYDVVCTTVYPLDREMGMRIGSSRLIDQIRRDDFALLGSSLGVGKQRMLRLLDTTSELLAAALDGGVGEAPLAAGNPDAESVVEKIAHEARGRINAIKA